MSQENLMELLLLSLRQAQSHSASALACNPMKEFLYQAPNDAPAWTNDVSDLHLPHSSLTTAPSHNASFVSYPTLIKSTLAPTKNFTGDGPYFVRDNVSQAMVFTMPISQTCNPTTFMNQVDNPFEPRPIHPSFETKADSFQGRAVYHRRMSVQHILEILNDIQPLDDDESLFHPSMMSSCEGNVADYFVRPGFEDKNFCCIDTDQDKSASRLSPVNNSSETDANTVMNLYKDLPKGVASQGNSSKEMSNTKPLATKSDEGEILLEHLLPVPQLLRLRRLMSKSRHSQGRLEEWDKKNGLPRSHCCTMMHTNRSRTQLEEGRILPKWNGAPLIR